MWTDVKIKDISRAFSKQFSCGASVDDIPTGGKEVVIQGDFMFQLPDILIKNYKVLDVQLLALMFRLTFS